VCTERRYRGYRLDELLIVEIAWSDRAAAHIQDRTRRYPDSDDELNIAPEWATEAALDPFGRLSLTESDDLRVLGWTPHAPAAPWSKRNGRVLRVVLWPVDIETGSWRGATAMPASENAANLYWDRRGDPGPA
jgi:hypothetical protein